ncbi:MAG: hypothetical protein K940chlam1_00970 [Candidatus Anoxychlamydiales bacterium]|nr:hypothetical protein [Candidatus Anoxychlamydiales bacterium]NGX35804.1 hypothetical protein [Candidatus Anoxychlamydiales bacterium]
MLYLIDGYNLLFRFFHSEKKLETQRNLAIKFLQEKTSLLKINAHLIFDAHNQDIETPSFTSSKTLKIIYTPKGQTADDYILERIFLSKTPSQIMVITSDRSLQNKAKDLNARTQSIDDFIDQLYLNETKAKKAHRKLEEETLQDTKYDIQRLLKIFEEKLKDETGWD